MRIRISCDDGCSSDKRLADLCQQYGVKTIFYWPVEWHSLAYEKGYEPLTFHDAFWIANYHEIGSHTFTHRHLTKISEEEAKYEIQESKYALQNMFKVQINKFAPPRGYTNDLLTEFTLKFYDKQRLTKEAGLVHIHPQSGANNGKNWLECINDDTTELFCHSWELDKYNLWDELETWLKSIS